MSLDGPFTQVRIARPTDQLREVERFYADLIGLPVLSHAATL